MITVDDGIDPGQMVAEIRQGNLLGKSGFLVDLYVYANNQDLAKIGVSREEVDSWWNTCECHEAEFIAQNCVSGNLGTVMYQGEKIGDVHDLDRHLRSHPGHYPKFGLTPLQVKDWVHQRNLEFAQQTLADCRVHNASWQNRDWLVYLLRNRLLSYEELGTTFAEITKFNARLQNVKRSLCRCRREKDIEKWREIYYRLISDIDVGLRTRYFTLKEVETTRRELFSFKAKAEKDKAESLLVAYRLGEGRRWEFVLAERFGDLLAKNEKKHWFTLEEIGTTVDEVNLLLTQDQSKLTSRTF